MIIEKNFSNLVCLQDVCIKDAMEKITKNKVRIIFVVDENNILLGSLSDGDLRRYLLKNGNEAFDVPINLCMRKDCVSVRVEDQGIDPKMLFKHGVEVVPVVDNLGRIKHFLFENRNALTIGLRNISSNEPCFIIAEIGNNHQGDIVHAKKLVDAAVEAGADCAKFQLRSSAHLYGSDSLTDNSADLGAQYTMDLLSRFQLSTDEMLEVFDYCKDVNIVPMCTPWDLHSLSVLEQYGMLGYKVASADFTNLELLEAISNTGKPMICSTGMSSETEVKKSIKFLDGLFANYILLHCNSTYPTPYRDINLNYLKRLSLLSKKPVGYSGHERGIFIPVAAVALGAKVIEKHITLDKNQEGTDHKVSLLPDEFKEMVHQIRCLEASMGPSDYTREVTQGEMINRENLAKSIVAKRAITKGEVITRNMLSIRSPGQGLQPNRLQELIGKKALRDIPIDSYLFETDIAGQISVKPRYEFNRDYGVPVRFHDYTDIATKTALDFVEFHLSYQDLELNIEAFIPDFQEIKMAVHCPELFKNDHILDLAASDKAYRQTSIEYLQTVIDKTLEIQKFFPKTVDPVIVVNAGGWDRNGFLSERTKQHKYELVAQSLKSLNFDKVTLAIQTMPPFPWHFGGQSYHNLFVDPDEIISFCDENPDIKICLDTSHTMMASNYFGWTFLEGIKKLLPYTVHMHIVDAKGIDGEGVAIGHGDIDFGVLFETLKNEKCSAQFIPEIWQGHKNSGEGFWNALNYLERLN